jgi:ribonuclease HI
MAYEKVLNIYTDGSSYSRPRRGGIGIRFVTIDEQGNEVVQEEVVSGHKEATNNEMELLASIKGLELAEEHPQLKTLERIVVFTDSLYVKENVPRAIFQWPRQKWLSREGRPIENATLWKELVRLIKRIPKRVDFEWVKGHSKDAHNKAVDKLAKQSAKGVLNPPLKVATVRRKRTTQTAQVGIVPMRGQSLLIRVITDTFMRVQRVYKYKYEVLEGSVDHVGCVDLIFADECLRAGHHYEVRVNDNTNSPRIVEIVRELERESSKHDSGLR